MTHAPATEAPSPLVPEPVAVTPLAPALRDAIGVLPSETTGFSPNLWGPTDAATARQLVRETPEAGLPEAQALLIRLLLAETDPPEDDSGGESLLTARIDRLLREGALEQADALIAFANPVSPADPALFRRWFDIGLLTDRTQPPCDALRRNPALSPTLPARIFCLARGGDWNAAEITLTLGKHLGSIPPDQEALLGRFLDPVLFEEAPVPPVSEPMTPLDFLMREAVGLPRPPGPLPRAFLHHDLTVHTPMRIRIEAAERLVRTGAISYAPLLAAFRAGAPAASGGVWDRASAIQALDAALGTGDQDEVAPALAEADARLTEAGFRVALAEGYADRLALIPPRSVPEETRTRIFELLLLAGLPGPALAYAPDEPAPRHAALLAILDGEGPLAEFSDRDQGPAAEAVVSAFSDSASQDLLEQSGRTEISEGRQGEVILRAVGSLSDGDRTPPPALARALAALRAVGQEDAARQIAVEALLQGGLDVH